MGTVFQIQRYCIHDGKGIRTCVFLKGCPLYCPWCHNPEGLISDTAAEKGGFSSREYTSDELVKTLTTDKKYFEKSGGGVTFTGGEPLLQAHFVAECAQKLKKLGISVAVETCGNVNGEAVALVKDKIDCVLFDIKQLDRDILFEQTGGKLDLILQNLRQFDGANIPIVLRVPLIVGFNFKEDFFKKLGLLALETKSVTHIELLPYHSLGEDKRRRLGLPQTAFRELTQAEKAFALDRVTSIYPRVCLQ